VAPNDTSLVYFSFSPTTLGAFADTIYLYGPDTNSFICVNALVTGAPNISTDSTSYHIHAAGCPDTVSFPFIIYNTGSTSLTWSTAGTVSGNKSDNFEGATFNTNVWASWTSGMSQGNSCGVINGTKSLIFSGSGARSIQTIPLNTSAGGSISFNYRRSTCEMADAGEGIYVFYSTNNGTTWTQIQYFYTTSTATQAAVMTIPVGAQGTNVIFKLEQTFNSGISFDYWVVDDFVISSGISNSIIFTPPSGTTAAAGSTSVTAQIVTTGLASGTYNLFAYVTSNDPVDPLLTIPVTLTINGLGFLTPDAACKMADTTIISTARFDSVMVINTGCAPVNITNVTESSAHFTAITISKTIGVNDTAYLAFNYLPIATGLHTDSLIATTNAGTFKFCIKGVGIGAPLAVASTTPINVTLIGCTDSATVQYTIANTGASKLTYGFYGQGADTIKIVALTLGYNFTAYNNALAALASNMTSPYQITTTNTTVASTLTTLLQGKDVLWIAPTTNAQYTGYTNLGPAVQAFLNAGGNLVISGTSYIQNIRNLNIFTAPATPTVDYGGYSISKNAAYSTHPLTEGLPTSFFSTNRTYSSNVTNTGARHLLLRNNDINYPTATEIDYGSGKAVWLGFTHETASTEIDMLLANCIEVYGSNGGSYADWLTISPDSGQVNTNASQTISFVFHAAGKGSGTYTDTVLIGTNDPLHPLIKVPVSITVNGAAVIDVQNNCMAFGSKYVGVPVALPTTIYNTGCDTLLITSNTSNTGAFSLSQLPLAIAPYDSVVASVNFTPNTVGFVQDTMMFVSNATPVGICVNGTGIGAPQVTPSVDTLQVTINKCDGFEIVPITVQNTGQGSMSYAMDIVSLYEGSSTKYYTTSYATTTHSFLNTPSTADTVFFMVVVNGDFNGSGGGEYYDITADGYYLNIYDNNVPDGTNDTSYGFYTGPNIATWLADGKLDVNISNAYGVAINTGLDMHHVKVWMKSTPTWASLLSTSTGTLAIGATTTKNVLLTASNLNVGTYNSSLLIESNDPVNPVYIVPIILNVVDKPVMAIATNCINYGQVLGNTPVTDSVKIYNTGCQNLNITSLQFTNAIFTSSISTAVIAAKDSMWLPITITAVAPGPINASVIIYSNDTNLSVCLTANVGFLPNTAFDHQVLDNCDGVVIFYDNTTNNPTNWNWDFGDGIISFAQNPTHTFTKPGIYTVKLVSYNISGVDSTFKTIDMTKVLFVDYSRPDSIFRNTPAQFYDSSLVATQWQWFFGDGGSSTLQNPIHSYANAGVYFVTFIASNTDCSTTLNRQITVYGGIGLEENKAQEIRVYPVPATDFVVVEWNAEAQFTSAQIVDALGNTLQTESTSANTLTIDASRFDAGIYFVILATNNGETVVKKFVVAR
jgi:PKD repeat protein